MLKDILLIIGAANHPGLVSDSEKASDGLDTLMLPESVWLRANHRNQVPAPSRPRDPFIIARIALGSSMPTLQEVGGFS